jgi:hypothetical protein
MIIFFKKKTFNFLKIKKIKDKIKIIIITIYHKL